MKQFLWGILLVGSSLLNCAENSTLFTGILYEVLRGGVAGTIGYGAAQPFLNMKYYRQTGRSLSPVEASLRGRQTAITYFRQLYAGYSATLSGVVPAVAIMFGAKKSLDWLLVHYGVEHNSWAKSMAAFGGGMIAGAICAPTEFLNVRKTFPEDSGKTLRTLVKQYRMKCFTRGLGAVMTRRGAQGLAVFALFPTIKRSGMDHGFSESISHFTAGIVTGGIATCATQPLDCIKVNAHCRLDRSWLDIWRDAFEQVKKGEGVLYYRGMSARFLAYSSFLTVQGWVTKFLDNMVDE